MKIRTGHVSNSSTSSFVVVRYDRGPRGHYLWDSFKLFHTFLKDNDIELDSNCPDGFLIKGVDPSLITEFLVYMFLSDLVDFGLSKDRLQIGTEKPIEDVNEYILIKECGEGYHYGYADNDQVPTIYSAIEKLRGHDEAERIVQCLVRDTDFTKYDEETGNPFEDHYVAIEMGYAHHCAHRFSEFIFKNIEKINTRDFLVICKETS